MGYTVLGNDNKKIITVSKEAQGIQFSTKSVYYGIINDQTGSYVSLKNNSEFYDTGKVKIDDKWLSGSIMPYDSGSPYSTDAVDAYITVLENNTGLNRTCKIIPGIEYNGVKTYNTNSYITITQIPLPNYTPLLVTNSGGNYLTVPDNLITINNNYDRNIIDDYYIVNKNNITNTYDNLTTTSIQISSQSGDFKCGVQKNENKYEITCEAVPNNTIALNYTKVMLKNNNNITLQITIRQLGVLFEFGLQITISSLGTGTNQYVANGRGHGFILTDNAMSQMLDMEQPEWVETIDTSKHMIITYADKALWSVDYSDLSYNLMFNIDNPLKIINYNNTTKSYETITCPGTYKMGSLYIWLGTEYEYYNYRDGKYRYYYTTFNITKNDEKQYIQITYSDLMDYQ